MTSQSTPIINSVTVLPVPCQPMGVKERLTSSHVTSAMITLPCKQRQTSQNPLLAIPQISENLRFNEILNVLTLTIRTELWLFGEQI